MILKIIILIVLLLITALLLFFLACILVPAVKEQTNIDENMAFSKIEHNFSKLEGLESSSGEELRAVVLCSCQKSFDREFEMTPIRGQTCSVINSVYGSVNDCNFTCIGMGDCARVCSQNAIIIKNDTAVVTNLCNGCGKCVNACPKNLIKMLPKDNKHLVICNSIDDELTTCSSLSKEAIIYRPGKRSFRFWRYFYRFLKGKK